MRGDAMSAADVMVGDLVRECYWRDGVNCATTMLRALSRSQGIELHPQVLAAATGMHGAGSYGAQCGLVEGGLMFLGVWGGTAGLGDAEIEEACNAFARGFEARFGSLSCRVLRPQGFAPGQPPHMCEGLTVEAVSWAVVWVGRLAAGRTGEGASREGA